MGWGLGVGLRLRPSLFLLAVHADPYCVFLDRASHRITPQRQLYKLVRERSTTPGQEPLFMFIEPETKSVKLAARYDVSLGEYIICRTRNVGLQNSDYIGGIRCVGHPPRARACGRGHSAGAAACGRGHSGAAARASLTCTSLRLSPY